MHSYHGEWVSVAEPQEDAFQTLTAASCSQQNQMNYGLKQPRRRSGLASPRIYSDCLGQKQDLLLSGSLLISGKSFTNLEALDLQALGRSDHQDRTDKQLLKHKLKLKSNAIGIKLIHLQKINYKKAKIGQIIPKYFCLELNIYVCEVLSQFQTKQEVGTSLFKVGSSWRFPSNIPQTISGCSDKIWSN